jgi:hypothetical protein
MRESYQNRSTLGGSIVARTINESECVNPRIVGQISDTSERDNLAADGVASVPSAAPRGWPPVPEPDVRRPPMATAKSKVERMLPGVTATLTLDVDGQSITVPMEAREFSTGSVGFYLSQRVPGQDGRKYQVGVNATLIHSKDAS